MSYEDVYTCKKIQLQGDAGVIGTALKPSLSWGIDTGFFETAANQLSLSIGGTELYSFYANVFRGVPAGSFALSVGATSATTPTLCPANNDLDTGVGRGTTDTINLIAGGISGIQYAEVSNKIIQTVNANVGLTADAGSAQGNGVILSSYNVYDTVGTAGDAATLPAAFEVGTLIYIKNGAAANSMDVFPASGDDLGKGVNTVEALAAGDFAVYMGTTANATWEKIMGGTA